MGSPSRPLGQLTLMTLGLNGVIGVGIFFVPAAVARQVPGPWGAAIYGLTALVCLPVALAFARLGARFDEDGGPYVYARAALGPRAAFFVGWLTYVSALFSTSAVIRGFAEALSAVAGGPLRSVHAVASLTAIALVGLVALGLRIASWAWTGVTVAKLLPLLLLLGVGLGLGVTDPQVVSAPLGAGAVSTGALLRAILLVLFTLQGFEVVPVPAQHVRHPKAISRATVGALVLAALLYVGLHWVCVRSVPALSESKAPLSEAAAALAGAGLQKLVSAGTNISAIGIALGMVAISPRYLSTLGRQDGLGPWLAKESRQGVPLRALILTGLAVLGLVQFGALDELFALSSIAVLAQYASTALSLMVLGIRKERGLGRGDVLLGTLSVLCISVVLLGASWSEMLRATELVVLGMVVRWAIGARRRQKSL